jgi:hypothetical protein
MTTRVIIWEYAKAKNLGCIVLDAAGRARVTRKPKSGLVWWAPFSSARKVARAINTKHASSFAEVEAAAHAYRIHLISHADVTHQAETAVRAVDSALDVAKRVGALKRFNTAFLAHREAATARGEHVPAYGFIIARLRRELMVHAVRGEMPPSIEEIVMTALPREVSRARGTAGNSGVSATGQEH